MRLAVLCPNLIGDTVMATPALRALRRTFPGARIDAILRPNVAPTLDGCPWIDERVLYHHRSARPEQRTRAVASALRRSRYDVALLLPNSFRSALLATLARIPRRVGYARGGRSWLLTDRLAPPVDTRGRYVPTPAVGYYLALARRLGCEAGSIRPELFTTPEDEAAADRAWARLGLGRRVVCLNTGGAFGPAKSWPADYFSTLAGRLAAERDADVLVLCGPAEREVARRIAAGADNRRVVALADEELSIGLTKACVKRSQLLVTTDSGPRHFAGAFGVPVVSLFGPTHIAWTRTAHPLAIHLQQPVPCGPCQRGVCPEGHHRCMVELRPEAVFDASTRLLGAAG